MKTHGLILLSALLIAALIVHGQEAAPPSVDLFPEQEEEPSPTPPPNGPELPELKELDESFKPKSLGKDADALQMHVLWRQLKNRTVNDPDVQAALVADGVIVTDWKEVMQRFEGSQPAAEKKAAPAEPAPAK